MKWDDLVDALLLQTEPDIPPQRGELDDQAKGLLAFACKAADKTIQSEKSDPHGRSPAKIVGPSGSTRRRISDNFSFIE